MPEAPKQAACLNCRKSKIRCDRGPDESRCRRCEQVGAECEIPDFHIGRQRGVKNKRSGLEKAIFQIEQAIKNKKAESKTPQQENAILELQSLVHAARTSIPSSTIQASSATPVQDTPAPGDEQLALDDAENPLQLLARASDLRLATPQGSEHTSFPNASTPSTRHHDSERPEKSDINTFFLPMKAHYDIGPENGQDTDPIDLGLVTLEEAATLLTFFHEKLAHTRWGLDPRVHTLAFVRNRSAFLFTSILAESCLFIEGAAALATRLSNHKRLLSQRIIMKRYRSVEIVLAFMVNVPWMHPGEHSADDDTGFYISTALSIALDLALNKIVIPSSAYDSALLKRVAKADCIDARKALAMDGFQTADPTSEWAQLLLRRRERVWIALFVLERGVCLARGRSYCVPSTPLTDHCDKWHVSELCDPRDGSLVSVTVLRRDLDTLFTTVRSRCDSYRVIDVGAMVAKEIETSIDSFYDRWLDTWTIAIGEGGQRTLPPYVEILLTHTRLSTYSAVINHPTAPLEVKRLFRASALSSALNVMRAAIQGEERLKSMPNNTIIMISFAACVALNLSRPTHSSNVGLMPSVRSLIEETADVLERLGSVPSHRNGMSVLYGKYLREIVRHVSGMAIHNEPPTAASSNNNNSMAARQASLISQQSVSASNSLTPMTQATTAQYQTQNMWTQPLQFSAMSDNEIIETVLRAGNDFELALPDIPMDDTSGFIWSDWMNAPEFGF